MRLGLWLCSLALVSHGADLEWQSLAPLPDAHGFAGMFAGVSGDALLAAGGGNFPEKPPWDGGTKAWSDEIWLLCAPEGKWELAGQLPHKMGYGVSIETAEGLLCVGGAAQTEHYAECFLLKWTGHSLERMAFPPLPQPCANACGARLGSKVYVAGGTASPTSTEALKSFWELDLANPNAGWRSLEPWPGAGRMLAVAASQEDAFYLFSGASLAADADGKPKRTYLKDAYRYRPVGGWTALANMPRAAVAAPSPALMKNGSLFVLGGDDGENVNFEPKTKHPGFPLAPLELKPALGEWLLGEKMAASMVTTPLVQWRGSHVIVSGERSPGIRSPAVWSIK